MLKLKNLDSYIEETQILRNISLEVESGEIVCLVGRNGAGKTTLFKSILGLQDSKGEIILNGEDVSHLPVHERIKSGIGYSPEEAEIFPDLTVEENIKLSIWLSGQSSDTMDNILDVLPEIGNFLKREGIYLSGGEKKITAIARALALDPDLLLIDEALEGLAPSIVEKMFGIIQNIKDMNKAVFMAESNLTYATRAADRLYAIERGEIIFEGLPEDLMKREELTRVLRGY